MRLSSDQVNAICQTALCQLSGALTMALGDRKIDVLLKDANTPPAPILEIARRTGVLI